VDVDIGGRSLDGAGHVDVIVAVEAGVDATLQRHLAGTALPRLARPLGNVVERQQVRRARRLSDSGPFENPQNRHLNVHTLV
jgi:hypothetical protein